MTMRFASRRGDVRPSEATPRGAAPVGLLQELPPVELAAIVYLRAWCDGGSARGMIARDFRLVMGDEAAAAVETFDALMGVLLTRARRPIMRHALDCRCFGGDESAFAHMIASAAGRDREDAVLFASTLVKGPATWSAVLMAEESGQVLLRLARDVAAGEAGERRRGGPAEFVPVGRTRLH